LKKYYQTPNHDPSKTLYQNDNKNGHVWQRARLRRNQSVGNHTGTDQGMFNHGPHFSQLFSRSSFFTHPAGKAERLGKIQEEGSGGTRLAPFP